MEFNHNEYHRNLVKGAIGCDDAHADFLLDFQFQVSNGLDMSEASPKAVKKFWQYIDGEFHQLEKEKGQK
jgi:hypothetical protein